MSYYIYFPFPIHIQYDIFQTGTGTKTKIHCMCCKERDVHCKWIAMVTQIMQRMYGRHAWDIFKYKLDGLLSVDMGNQIAINTVHGVGLILRAGSPHCGILVK